MIPYVEFAKEIKGGRPLIIDTSALIDGRISDVMDTSIFDTELIVPSFVLEELQNIADSQDKNRRTRGRRGLDVLTKLQQKPKVEVRMLEVREKDDTDHTVDQRIVSLAKRMSGRVVTNDFNLNKVASVQGVDVINLNDVANALKPRFICRANSSTSKSCGKVNRSGRGGIPRRRHNGRLRTGCPSAWKRNRCHRDKYAAEQCRSDDLRQAAQLARPAAR